MRSYYMKNVVTGALRGPFTGEEDEEYKYPWVLEEAKGPVSAYCAEPGCVEEVTPPNKHCETHTAFGEWRDAPAKPAARTTKEEVERIRAELGLPEPGTPAPTALSTQVSGNHYKSLAIQPVEYIHKNNIGYMEGNVIKYVTRWRDKGGIADLEKAKHYIELLIELERGK